MARKGKNQAKAQGKKKSKNGAQRRSSAKSRGGNVSVVIRGNGDYEVGPVEDLGSYQKALALRRVGQMAGEKVGMPRLGRMAGAGFSKFVGHGDYQVKTNSLIKGALSSGPEMVPYFSRTGKSGIRVREREFLGFVVTGANGVYTSTSYHINPGLQGAFPWLSQVAQNFEEWEPYGLVYEFVSTSAQFAGGSNQALGTVAMATDYDVLDSTFINMTELLNMGAACSTRSSNDLEHGVECDITERGRRSFFVRTGAPPTQSTLMDYDLGLFEIATQGSPAATGGSGRAALGLLRHRALQEEPVCGPAREQHLVLGRQPHGCHRQLVPPLGDFVGQPDRKLRAFGQRDHAHASRVDRHGDVPAAVLCVRRLDHRHGGDVVVHQRSFGDQGPDGHRDGRRRALFR